MPSEQERGRIYLDNAATSWPKPDSVYEAVNHYLRECGAAAGRGSYSASTDADSIVSATRIQIAQLINANQPKQVIFANNGTDALNLAILGFLRSGEHVVTTVVEHNSVLRPLRHARDQLDVEVTYVGCDAEGHVAPQDIRDAITEKTSLICLTHASNVTGTIQPIAEVAEIARKANIAVLIDAAQSAGKVAIDSSLFDKGMIAAPGHKGLYGPLGVGFVALTDNIVDRVSPIRFGGTGTRSHEDQQPTELPERFESGNLNVPAIAGLKAGIETIRQKGIESIQQAEHEFCQILIEQISSIESIRILGPTRMEERCGVISLSIDHIDPREASSILDQAFQIQTRSGFHCAPLIHRAIGSEDCGGTLRLSPGIFNSVEQAQLVAQAILSIADM